MAEDADTKKGKSKLKQAKLDFKPKAEEKPKNNPWSDDNDSDGDSAAPVPPREKPGRKVAEKKTYEMVRIAFST